MNWTLEAVYKYDCSNLQWSESNWQEICGKD